MLLVDGTHNASCFDEHYIYDTLGLTLIFVQSPCLFWRNVFYPVTWVELHLNFTLAIILVLILFCVGVFMYVHLLVGGFQEAIDAVPK